MKTQRKRQASSTARITLILVTVLSNWKPGIAFEKGVVPELFGIGYYEQGTQNGIYGASMAGGTEVVFYGQGMSMSPAGINSIFTNAQYGALQGPHPKQQDMAFNSHTDGGKLKYTTPSLMELHGQPYEYFNTIDNVITYQGSLIDVDDMTQQVRNLACIKPVSNCNIRVSRAYTPLLYYISPRVVYEGSQVEFFIDPRSAQDYKSKIFPEFPFTQVHLNNYGVNFEGFLEEDTVLPTYTMTNVRGLMGAITPSKSVQIDFQFRVGYALHLDSQMMRCDYYNQTCYKAKAVGAVYTIDSKQGYTTGGQSVTVTGNGFTSTQGLNIIIDGAPCNVTSSELHSFQCLTSPQPTPSPKTQQYFLGQHGLRRKFYNSSNPLNWSNILVSPDYNEVLAQDFEAPLNYLNGNYGNIYSGYFKAPATANYRFYMSCDDWCQFYFSNVTMDPTKAVKLLEVTSSMNYRRYLTLDGRRHTNWISLKAGESYYIEMRHVNFVGGNHATVSLEIQDPDIVPGHQNTMKEIQRLSVSQINVREQTQITINNPDLGTFNLTFINPVTKAVWTTYAISASASSWEMTVGVQAYYSSVWGASIQVTKVSYDASGAITTISSLIVQSVYTITVTKSITGASSNQITPKLLTSQSIVSIVLPKNLQLSSPPMTGSFKFVCPFPDGTSNTTADIDFYASGQTMTQVITASCPYYREKFTILDSGAQNFYQDGRDLLIRFVGLNEDIQQWSIISSTQIPVSGNQVYFNSTTWIDYDPTHLFYEPLPFEFLFTNETQPQMIMSVNGVEIVCNTLDCGYKYVDPVAQVLSFSHAASTLTILGSSFVNPITTIMFSNIPCTNVKVHDPQTITCTVVPVVGQWQPIVTDTFGFVPINTAQVIEVPLTVTGVSPSTDLNPVGGTVITITGTSFPQSLSDGYQISALFSDGTQCIIESTSSTQILCLPQQFQNSTTTATLALTVNGLVYTGFSVTISPSLAMVTSISPNSVSPVLKNILTIYIQDFPETLSVEDLSVWVVSQKNTSIVRYINVIEVNNVNGNQYIRIKFGGSQSGLYDLHVTSRSYGKLESTGVTLELIGVVTSFSPTSGSVHGGTLITINGYHFSNDPMDNPVQIGYTECQIESTSETQITCRTLPAMQEVDYTDDVIVFLKTYEEAQCTANPCTFDWVATNLPALTDYSVDFDTTLNDYVLTLTGTGFTASLTNTEVDIDTMSCPLISASDTQVQVQVTNALNSTVLNVDFYLPIGLPNGLENLTINTGFTMTPVLLSLYPNVGSPAGSVITAIVKGVGIHTNNITLVNSTGSSICAVVSISQYGVLTCLTNDKAFTLDQISVKQGWSTFGCLGTTDVCQYSTAAVIPTVTSVSTTDSLTISLTGSNLQQLPGYTPQVMYANVSAVSVTIVSNTQMTATFVNGVPVSTNARAPIVTFYNATTNTTHKVVQASSVTLTNTVTATAIVAPVQCSFAGGCLVSVAQPGLLSNMQQDPTLNEIQVCGNPCILQSQLSSSSAVKCMVPSLDTMYSLNSFNITPSTQIMGTPFSSYPYMTMTVFDGSMQQGWTDMNGNCSFGTAFRPGFVGVLTQVQYFMNRFTSANYVGNLKFQGSQDGVNYTDIFTVGLEIHEGWNYHAYGPGQELKYRFYRFLGAVKGSCVVGEISFEGYEAINDSNSTYTCQAQVILGGIPAGSLLAGSITYESSLTPLLQSISPRFGTVVGGELISFSGSNFASDISLYIILIDNRTCAVQTANSTTVTCITSKRPGLYPEPSLEINIAGMGQVATQGLIFRYANYWSNTITWGGEFAPIEGDMVYIPAGLHLLVDVDSTPVLSAVLVEGSLIFPSGPTESHLRTFDSHYVLIKGGYFEAGTEHFPYTSQLQITMHSIKTDPELPIFGNKVIAVYGGVLDFHGVPRYPTWTMLDITSDIGSDTLTIIEQVDWKIGERIVIAPTSYYNYEAEEVTIVSIDRTNPSKPILTIDPPLLFKHFAGVQHFGNDFIEMRAEVGLLTRNILYRGDPETSTKNEYGAHMMIHSDDSGLLIARIAYIELFNVGQAFQLGRYPIHFHQIGAVHDSYIIGNAIHQSYNRACTIHGVRYLRLISNVAYNIKGHTFFIEDAIETNNFLEHNLAIYTKKSWSLLNSDQTPASFWITHPNNIFRGNHAAGADNYGFWFDTKPNPTGPSFDPNICPENSPLGEFTNNVAHSNGRYGLRLFHKLKPRQYPCQSIVYDPSNLTDPYWQNPVITASFINFTSYKNLRNGAIALDVADVHLINFKVADNILAGIEFEKANTLITGYAQVNGALVVGRSDNADYLTNTSNSHGIIGARTEGLTFRNIKFYNFDIAGKAAIGSCSHCFVTPSTDSGARTTTFEKLYFDNSVTIKINYETPYRDIFLDLDGSLTGLGPNSWATPYWRHNDYPECILKQEVYDGLICNSSIELRRVVFYNFKPAIFSMMDMKVIQVDDYILQGMDDPTKTNYFKDIGSYSIVPYRTHTSPKNAWAIPMVTNKKYKIHWQWGLDFTQMQVDLSEKWKPSDHDIQIVMNFTDVRAKYDFLTAKDNILNGTLLSTDPADHQTGAFILYNETEVRELHFLLNGKNATRNQQLLMQGTRCIGACMAAINTTVPIETNYRLWSNPASWPNNTLPKQGDNIVIEPGQNFVFDLENSPVYDYVQINGRVTFKQDAAKLNLTANYIFVRAGELIIGNATNPYLGQAYITLNGSKDSEQMVYTNAIEGGNKVLANTALISFFGRPRIHRSRLLITSQSKDTKITVESGLSWITGEQIGLAPSTFNHAETDYAIIQSYDNLTGIMVLDRKLNHYHWGALSSTGPQYSGVDMRTEIVLLSRNIKIMGTQTDGWGGQIVTSDFVEADGTIRAGMTIMDHVEIHNCSQYDTLKAALRFEGSSSAYSLISNSAIHHGFGMGITTQDAGNIILLNNTVYQFQKFGISIANSVNVTVDGNWVISITSRHLNGTTVGDPQGGILGCATGSACWGIHILNNVVSGIESGGVDTTGYSVYAHECGDYNNIVFRNNTAHSIHGYGAIIFKNLTASHQFTCLEASYFTAYKCTVGGIVSNQQTAQVVFTQMTLIDNGIGAAPMVGIEGEELWMKIKDSTFYGETEARSCPYQNFCQMNNIFRSTPELYSPGCIDTTAILISAAADHFKPPLISGIPAWPQYKIKASASWGGNTLYENINFINFKTGDTWCGATQRLFRENAFSADYNPAVRLLNPRFENVHTDALASLFTPPNEWATIDDCGQFPCTGPNNVLIAVEKSTFVGTIKPFNTFPEFQIISGNKFNGQYYDSCQFQSAWNGYYCNNDQIAILIFESQDSDNWTRIISPINVVSMNTSEVNVLNTMMDHGWDGFYTSLKRLSRYPTLILGGPKRFYEIKYTSTPPMNQRFSLRSDHTQVTIRIRYTYAQSYQVLDYLGNVITQNKWDPTISAPAMIKGTSCGENRFVGIENLLEFHMSPSCNISIKPVDSIRTNVRMNWTVSQFYASGGTTQFSDRMASVLGIGVANMKIVSVYEGSVYVNFDIIEDVTGILAKAGGLALVQTNLQTVLNSTTTNLGAPILGASISMISAPTQAPNISTIAKTTQNSWQVGSIKAAPVITAPAAQPVTTVVTPTTTKKPIITAPVIQNVSVVTIKTDVVEQSTSGTNPVLIPVVGTILGVVVLGTLIAYCLYKKYQKPASHSAVPDQSSSTSRSESKIATELASPDKLKQDDDNLFEQQFHPAQDYFSALKARDIHQKANEDTEQDEDLQGDKSSQPGQESDPSVFVTESRMSKLNEEMVLNDNSEHHQEHSLQTRKGLMENRQDEGGPI